MNKIPYAYAVGCLMYLMVCTRPNIAYAISLVSIYIACPGKLHWQDVKQVFQYLNDTKSTGLVFGKDKETDSSIIGYVDSDFAKIY